jgi:Ca-activated chloride channel family protein
MELDPTNGMELAYVTVVNKDHVSIPGLKKENFKITEDGVDQKLELFSVDDSPISVGFVLGGPPNESRGVPLEFLKATPWTTNEFFLINDNHSPPGGTVIQSFTTDLMKATATYPSGGVTADSIFMGLDYLKEAANKRKLLILIGGTLSGDAAIPGSGLDPYYVERVATKQEVQVYSILTSNDGGDVYDDGGTSYISPLTGGKNYLATPISFSLESTAREIAQGLGVQYEVGYRSTNPTPDGKWRRIRVSVIDPPETAGKISVWTRAGYYVEKEKKKK